MRCSFWNRMRQKNNPWQQRRHVLHWQLEDSPALNSKHREALIQITFLYYSIRQLCLSARKSKYFAAEIWLIPTSLLYGREQWKWLRKGEKGIRGLNVRGYSSSNWEAGGITPWKLHVQQAVMQPPPVFVCVCVSACFLMWRCENHSKSQIHVISRMT